MEKYLILKNLTNFSINFGIKNLPTIEPLQKINVLDFCSEDELFSNSLFKNYLEKNIIEVINYHDHQEYAFKNHTHIFPKQNLLPHTHKEFLKYSILNHKHINYLEEKDLSNYITKDILNKTIEEINKEISIVSEHTIEEHKDTKDIKIEDLKKLLDGSNCDELHNHQFPTPTIISGSNPSLDFLLSNTPIVRIYKKFKFKNDDTYITSIKDEDDMASNSSSSLATQQSIKTYIDDNDFWTRSEDKLYPEIETDTVIVNDLFVNGDLDVETIIARNPSNGIFIDGNVEIDGDLIFSSSKAGLISGCIYGIHIDFQQALVQNIWYPILDSDITFGCHNHISFVDGGYLKIERDGIYLINFSLSIKSSIANKHIEISISINDGGGEDRGMQHVELKFIGASVNVSGTCFLPLEKDDTICLTVSTTDTGTPTATIGDLDLTILQIAG